VLTKSVPETGWSVQSGSVTLLGRNDLDAIGKPDTGDDLRQLVCAFHSKLDF